MREIALLKNLGQYPNFVKMFDVIIEQDSRPKSIHCIFEFCDSTLLKFLAKHDRERKPLSLVEIQTIMKSLLESVSILHGKMILHRDIKPDNILIDTKGQPGSPFNSSIGVIKLADFGLSKKATFLQRRKSNSIVSLWYRAPEIILGS